MRSHSPSRVERRAQLRHLMMRWRKQGVCGREPRRVPLELLRIPSRSKGPKPPTSSNNYRRNLCLTQATVRRRMKPRPDRPYDGRRDFNALSELGVLTERQLLLQMDTVRADERKFRHGQSRPSPGHLGNTNGTRHLRDHYVTSFVHQSAVPEVYQGSVAQ